MRPWIPEYDSDEQWDQNCLNQHSTDYQLQENWYGVIGKKLWKQLKRVSISIFDGNKKAAGRQHSWQVLIKLQVQQNISFSNCASTFQEKP